MTRTRRVVYTGPAVVALVLASAGWLSAPAAVAAPVAATPATLACGATIAQNTTLTHDLGPCPGDGLVVTSSNITVNLAGHTITGSHQVTSTPASEQVGIHLEKASNVTVENGTVQYFDGGVAVEGGSANTVRAIFAHDNINRDLLANVDPSQQPLCNYGDGILTDNSDNNRIEGNRAVHNGPFSGIALLDTSSFNSVIDNQATNNYVVDQTPNGGGTLCGSSAGTITGGMGSGRTVQDMGIRIEGAGATYNKVEANQVTH